MVEARIEASPGQYMETLQSERDENGATLQPSATAPALNRPNNLILQSQESNDEAERVGNLQETPEWVRQEHARHRRILSETLNRLQRQQNQQQDMWFAGSHYASRFRMSRVGATSNNVSDFMRAQDEVQALQQQAAIQNHNDQEQVLSSGRLCKYFFTQMSVTVLFLVIFEAQSDVEDYQRIEKFLVYQCLLLVADLLFFLFRSVKPLYLQQLEGEETLTQRLRNMTCSEGINALVSVILYFAQIGWLIYGNYLYFNLPMDSLDNASEQYEAEIAAADAKGGEVDHLLGNEQINSEKWLYVALMSVLTVGYIHLMIFAAIILIAIVTGINSCIASTRGSASSELTQQSHFSAVKLWQFIDEGIFSLLDELDEPDYVDAGELHETRAEVERRLALEKLDEKPFETVRLDTIDQIREGLVKGSLNSFRSPSNASMSSPMRGNQSYFAYDGQSQSVFDVASRSANHDAAEPTPINNEANPQTDHSYVDPLFDYRGMNNPETYFVPAPRQKTTRDNGDMENPLHITGFECAICQERFERTSMVCQMPCHIKHIFHSECIRPWIKKQNACPLCKQAIPVSAENLPESASHDDYQQAERRGWDFSF